MDSVIEHLVDKENKIIKLLTPAFTGKKYDPGYISHYPIGVRENGGHFIVILYILVLYLYCILYSFQLLGILFGKYSLSPFLFIPIWKRF